MIEEYASDSFIDGNNAGYDEAWDEARDKGFDEGWDAAMDALLGDLITRSNFIYTPEDIKELNELVELHNESGILCVQLVLNFLHEQIESMKNNV